MRFLLLLLLSFQLYSQEILHYEVRNGDSTVQSKWELSKYSAVLTRLTETQRYGYNGEGETIHYELKDSVAHYDYTIDRSESHFVMEGIVKGKKVSRKEPIDSLPWFQSVHDLSAFALESSDSDSKIFWLIRPVDLKVVKMKATIEDETDQTVTIRVAPTGIMSLLWKAFYTYRKSDGLFVEYRSIHGPPGTPETVVSLLRIAHR